MANPQLEEGYVAISNELYDALTCAGLGGGEYSVVLAVIRKTYGWNKKADTISHKQIMELTGIKSRRWLIQILQGLEAKNILIGTHRHGVPTVYAVNKDHESWTGVGKLQRTCEEASTCQPDSTAHVSNSAQHMSVKQHSTCELDSTHKNQVQPSTTKRQPQPAKPADADPVVAKCFDLLRDLMPGSAKQTHYEQLRDILADHPPNLVRDVLLDMQARGNISHSGVLPYLRKTLNEKAKEAADSADSAKPTADTDNPYGYPPNECLKCLDPLYKRRVWVPLWRYIELHPDTREAIEARCKQENKLHLLTRPVPAQEVASA